MLPLICRLFPSSHIMSSDTPSTEREWNPNCLGGKCREGSEINEQIGNFWNRSNWQQQPDFRGNQEMGCWNWSPNWRIDVLEDGRSDYWKKVKTGRNQREGGGSLIQGLEVGKSEGRRCLVWWVCSSQSRKGLLWRSLSGITGEGLCQILRMEVGLLQVVAAAAIRVWVFIEICELRSLPFSDWSSINTRGLLQHLINLDD